MALCVDPVEEDLCAWKNSNLKSLDIGGMFVRNPVAHKWKAPFRAWLLRELVSLRSCEIITQSYTLWKNGDRLASLILMRSAIETVAILVDINARIEKVVAGEASFHDFSDHTTRMLLGAKDGSTSCSPINILTILKNWEKKYPGVQSLYDKLSEVAHPNHDGLKMGYADLESQDFTVYFRDRWVEKSADRFEIAFDLCRDVFVAEYNHNFKTQMENFETWIEQNNDALTASQPKVAG